MRPGSLWACPICRLALEGHDAGRRLACARGHSFDVAREGYVNLLIAGQRRSHQPGDSPEMVTARARFLATGAYDRMSDAIGRVVARAGYAAADRDGPPATILDVGCGDGHHTRRVAAALEAGPTGEGRVPAVVAGVDVSKAAVALAARRHREGHYAVASAADLPLETAAVEVAIDVFGPVVAEELARVVRPGGTLVAAHPGRDHLAALRRLVYADAHPHEVKDPLRAGAAWFVPTGSVQVSFAVDLGGVEPLVDLFAMTPYRWHAPPDILDRLAEEAAAPGGFRTEANVIVSTYRRR